MGDPFLIKGPAQISFSGGRSSAYMLGRIIQAHGGTLPDDVHVCFANTGKEREETLRFVYECEARWNVRIRWLEYRGGTEKHIEFEEVDFNSASRFGEPFDALIAKKKGLPNWQARWCTSFLKVLPMQAFMRSQGLAAHLEVIGLRADEPWRLLKMRARNDEDGRQCRAPLEGAGITKREVLTFWRNQEFDLRLEAGAGNCDLCFMKGAKLRASLIRFNPGMADWWVQKEAGGHFFDRRTRYATITADIARSPDLFAHDSDADDEHDAECGLWCAA